MSNTTLCEHVLDVAVAGSEPGIEPDGLLYDDAAKSGGGGMRAYPYQKRLHGPCVPSHCFTVPVPSPFK